MSKVSVRIDADERYPDFHLVGGPYGYEAEVEAETLARWEAAIDTFNAVQDEMRDAYKAAGGSSS